MSVALPEVIAAALAEMAQARSGSALRDAAASLSDAYRASVTSAAAIRSEADAAAYALSRMPATYAAVTTVLGELAARAPDFQPRTMIDAGAGPGTATWAATRLWDSLAAAELRDTNPNFLALAGQLAARIGGPLVTPRRADLAAPAATATANLVVCAYAITELADSALERAATALWQQTSGALVIVEPGRPRDFARLLTIRTVLVGQGATVLAPCPHGAACPLAAPDWCHFSVRLPRSRAHVQMKGASLGYEDEKFSYLVVARPGLGVAAEARLIRPPHVSKHTATLPLCTTDGLRTDSISSRDPARFKAARKLDWGDVNRF